MRLTRRVAARAGRRRRARNAAAWPYVLSAMAPPPLGPDQRPAPPDFVGVGVQKAGTSWWHSLIADHPGVHAPKDMPKELHYFDRFWDNGFTDADRATYHRWFARPEGLLSGEWTPRYVYDVWTPALLRVAAPDTRVLVLLRDPVERYRSQLARDFDRQAPAVPLIAQDAFHRGLYAVQLERLFDHFPRDQALVLQYERCRDETVSQLERTYRFLGLDPSYRPARLSDHVGPRLAKRSLPEHLERELRLAYAAQLPALSALVPDLDAASWSLAGQ